MGGVPVRSIVLGVPSWTTMLLYTLSAVGLGTSWSLMKPITVIAPV